MRVSRNEFITGIARYIREYALLPSSREERSEFGKVYDSIDRQNLDIGPLHISTYAEMYIAGAKRNKRINRV